MRRAGRGAELNSSALVFTPSNLRAGDYRFQIATAGAACWCWTVLPALMLADGPSKVELAGGTHNPMAPPFDFLERAFAPAGCSSWGWGWSCNCSDGALPRRGRELVAHITPATPNRPLAPIGCAGARSVAQRLGRGTGAVWRATLPRRALEALGQRMGWTFEGGQLRQPPYAPERKGRAMR